MNRFVAAAGIIFIAIGVARAADQTLTGTISDSMCGAKHMVGAEHNGAKMTDRQCTKACVKKGAQYVFVSQGKVYTIANQTDRALALNVGHRVNVVGSVNGDTLTVSKITRLSKKHKS